MRRLSQYTQGWLTAWALYALATVALTMGSEIWL